MKKPTTSIAPIRIQRVVVVLVISILFTISFVSFVFAEPIHTRLNPDLVSGGAIGRYAVSPNGSYVAYIADQETDGVDELYIAPIEGGTTTKLNPTLVAGGGVYGMLFTPNSDRIIYNARQESPDFDALYSVPSTGGVSTNLSGIPPEQAYPFQYKISPDGKRLVFTFERRTSNNGFWEFALVSTPIDQSEPVTLKLMPSETGSIHRFIISPDSKWVIYSAGDLYSVPIEGGESIKLNQDGESLNDFVFTPSGTDLVYSVYKSEKRYNYRVPITGGESTVIGGSKAEMLYTMLYIKNSLSPDGRQVLALDNQMNTSSAYTATYRLYAALLDGNEPLLLSSTDETEGTNTMVEGAEYLPDGSGVVFSLKSLDGGKYVYYVPSTGGAKTKLIGPINAFDTSQRDSSFMLTMDGKKVLHLVPDPFLYSRSLLLTDLASNTTITLATIAEMNPHHDFSVDLSPDGNSVIYSGRSEEGAPIQYFGASLTDYTIQTLTLSMTQDVGWPVASLHGNQVCLVYGVNTPDPFDTKLQELYSSCYEANGPNRAYLPILSR